MKLLATVAVLIISSCVTVAVFQQTVSARRAIFSQANTSPNRVSVIVELFTSEGCSTCPPADALLMQLENQQPIPGTQVLALEEHVDYWNNGGWFDPFSSSEMTERQQRYDQVLNQGSPYTPQMVVNGQWAFVGSRSNQAVQAITASAKEARSEVEISANASNPVGQSEWTVRVNRVEPASGDTAEVWLAITETGLHSNVGRGENAGRNLAHASVVRQLTKLGAADPSKDPPFLAIEKPKLRPEWNRQNLRIVAFVQQKKSRHILGAASAMLAP